MAAFAATGVAANATAAPTAAPTAATHQAASMPSCPNAGPPQVLTTDLATFEGGDFDDEGRLVVSNWLGSNVHRMDTPGRTHVINPFLLFPLGVVNNDDGRMVVGNGVTTLAPLSQFIPSGQLLSMNPDDGDFHAYARQLVSQGNGLTRGPDGSIYASNDLAASLDKILPNGHVIKGFYQSSGTNGGTVSADGKTLYVTETFTLDAKVIAIDTTTGRGRVYWRPPASLAPAHLDDVKRDGAGNLYVAAWGAGQVWRVSADGESACVLMADELLPAGLVVGKNGTRFAPHSLFVLTHGGRILEIPDAVPTPRPAT
ncbi:SMP-30/gluconolactonase/LRE family protein [Gordonia aquimaris]|uniref:SMP-30/gluconolactonase/LRE family protein n=1 Tax=Gordonia aquimaris TaxID=2984863 RepID=A0A9X3D5F8_9ACTN|nr:SMP-30/gluconolactonase/LRE family protein [Gordonia aquimaris]MCX2965424.1 SMP-30/gluconolactonase/LRE family protein [Gordonia aquimaris]